MPSSWSFLTLALAAAAGTAASFLSNDLSFGQSGRISPNGRGIPNFHLLGNPNPPEILSNKIILTPIAPGHQRGGAWGEKAVDLSVWTLDVDFRATGPERGGGNFNIWYVKDGQNNIASSSIYTAGKWDGLAIVVDTYGGSGGTIRGFLNDGTTHYKDHHSVDSLAFGHCSYAYRNRGSPSQLKIEHTGRGLKVSIDNKLCFESDKIILPRGNTLGLSAASADTPDSFEVFKFVVTTNTPQADTYIASYETANTPVAAASADQPPAEDANTKFDDDPNFVAAEAIDSSQHFQDLHNRLQAIMKHITALQRDVNRGLGKSMAQHNELKSIISAATPPASTQPQLTTQNFAQTQNSMKQLENKMSTLEKKLDDVLKEVSDPRRWNDLHTAVRDQHDEVFRHLPEKIAMHIPNSGLVIFFLVCFQIVLMGAYVMYKRRLANMPKKYL